MLVCYLDDSGQDPGNMVSTLAGYLARESSWEEFEQEVEPIFEKYGVNVLHAKDLESTRGEFKGWKLIKKQAFVARVCAAMAKHSILGVSMSVAKDTYDLCADESQRRRTNRPHTFCMNVIVDWLLRDIRTGRAVWSEGVEIILESGHKNNPEAIQAFQNIIEQHQLQNVLRSITCVHKTQCRAIQMADLFAFYSRREGNALERASRAGEEPPKMEQMLKIITEKGPFRGYVANDFEPNDWTPFFAGDL